MNRNGFFIRAREIAIFFSFAALVFLIYSNTFDAPFILDDGPNIEHNPNIRMTRISLEKN